MRLADLEVSAEDGLVVARIIGEIDMSNAEELSAALTASMDATTTAMVLDLTSVDYLDSAGIRLLYRLGESLQARRQKLEVVMSPTSMVADVLRLAGVSEHIGAVETVDEARARLADG